MQYELTEEQRMLQDMVRRLAKERVEPGATRRDAEGEFDWEMVDLMRENGLYGIDFPEAYGGSGAGMLALAIAVEELSKVDAACGLLVADHEHVVYDPYAFRSPLVTEYDAHLFGEGNHLAVEGQ